MPEAWALTAAYHRALTTAPDPDRLARAMDFLLTPPNERHQWRTTLARCDCPDSLFRKAICKHRLAQWLEVKARQIEAEASKEAA